jgi:hypothetical protein
LFSHLVIVIHHSKAKALKFLLNSELNKIMSSSIGSASVLLAVQPVISKKIVILSTRTHRGGFRKRRNRQAKK